MASRFLHEAQRDAGRGSIDLPLALLAGLSVGFVAFVMPADLFARAVELSRLPSVLPAAQPPLGGKAHAAFALAAAGGTILAVFLLLRMLGGEKARPRQRHEPEPEREAEAPRLRRSDVHPDAPARRPILAAREFGEPVAAPSPPPAPFWRPDDFSAEPEEGPREPEAELELDGPGIEILDEPAPEPEIDTPVAAEPAPALAADAVEPAPVEGASLPDLIERLERGLARRLQDKGILSATAPQPAPAEPVGALRTAEGGDERLRSAIENLQKMAARAG
jgi:hypothetical protein